MTDSPPTPEPPTEQALAATEQAETLLRGHPAELSNLLRLLPGRRAVFSGQYDGRAAVFHMALAPAAARAFARGAEESHRLRSYMSQGPYRVPEPLALLEDGAMCVTARVGGTPLLEFLKTMPEAGRPAMAPRVAGWLATQAAPSLIWRGANKGPWRRWALEQAPKQPYPELVGPESRLLELMLTLARQVEGDWRVSLAHGDYHPNNLIWSPGRELLWGIDISAAGIAPIYRDMARYLVHSARRDMLPSGRQSLGVDAGQIAAFTRAFELTEIEQKVFLPYFLCYETLVRVEDASLPPRRIRLARRMTEAMIADLEVLLGG